MSHVQGVIKWGVILYCSLLLQDLVFHGVSSAGSRDGEGTPREKYPELLEKALTLQNASM